VFLEDLKHRLADLYHTREILQQKKSRGSGSSSQQQQLLLSSTDSVVTEPTTPTTRSSDELPVTATVSGVNSAELEPAVEVSSLATSVSATAGDSVAESAAALATTTGSATQPMNTPISSAPINTGNNADQDQELHGFLNADDPSAFSYIPPTVRASRHCAVP
jgi:hypothetical protein